jgi:uncharacterized protein with FMN-binding domain
MLNPRRDSLAGKLLLSSVLVAVSLAYGWWQAREVKRPVVAMAPMPPKPMLVPDPVAAVPAAPTEPAPQDAPSTPVARDVTAAAPKTAAIVKVPQPVAPTAREPQQTAAATPPPALTPQQALQMYVPMEGASPAFPPVSGSPDAGAVAPLPAGMHLADGDFVSDRHTLMWGDLRVKISIQGGAIRGMQVLQFPDHRSQSLYLSQLSLPVLQSEVIKNQKAQVDVVSSATDTSYTFQDAVADAITKATRG